MQVVLWPFLSCGFSIKYSFVHSFKRFYQRSSAQCRVCVNATTEIQSLAQQRTAQSSAATHLCVNGALLRRPVNGKQSC